MAQELKKFLIHSHVIKKKAALYQSSLWQMFAMKSNPIVKNAIF
ncbi:MAG: hypothetical protein PWR20_521 [Bacteroidales bacterium]|jgi:hypothetical protein|nr:hypothetical protein [Bacteroidales bacterium]